MREPDVRLTDDERATFTELERLLTAQPRARARLLRWVTPNRRVLGWVVMAVTGGLVMVVGLVTGTPAVGAIGFVMTVFGIARSTRRVTWRWCVLRWRRQLAPPTPPEHMWDPESR